MSIKTLRVATLASAQYKTLWVSAKNNKLNQHEAIDRIVNK